MNNCIECKVLLIYALPGLLLLCLNNGMLSALKVCAVD